VLLNKIDLIWVGIIFNDIIFLIAGNTLVNLFQQISHVMGNLLLRLKRGAEIVGKSGPLEDRDKKEIYWGN
jgi:hypothetical protein